MVSLQAWNAKEVGMGDIREPRGVIVSTLAQNVRDGGFIPTLGISHFQCHYPHVTGTMTMVMNTLTLYGC